MTPPLRIPLVGSGSQGTVDVGLVQGADKTTGSVRASWRRLPYIDVTSVGTMGAGNDAAIIKEALTTSAYGKREIYIPRGTYDAELAITHRIANGQDWAPRIVGDGVETIIRQTSGAFFTIDLRGQIVTTGVALTADVVAGDRTLQVASVPAEMVRGCWLTLYSEALAPNTDKGANVAEKVRVASVTGTTVTLQWPTKYSYGAADATGQRAKVDTLAMLDGGRVEGINIVNTDHAHLWMSAWPVYRHLCSRFSDAVFTEGLDTQGHTARDCVDYDVLAYATDHLDDETNNAYGYGACAQGGSRWGRYEVHADGVRHSWTNTAGSAMGHQGVPQDMTVTGTARRTTNAAWDGHPEGDGVEYVSITADHCFSAGLQVRSKNTIVRGLVGRHLRAYGVWVRSMADYCRIDDIDIQDVVDGAFNQNSPTPITDAGHGVYIEAPDGQGSGSICELNRPRFNGVDGYGVMVEIGANPQIIREYHGRNVARDQGAGSQRHIYFDGTSAPTDPEAVHTVVGGTFIGGSTAIHQAVVGLARHLGSPTYRGVSKPYNVEFGQIFQVPGAGSNGRLTTAASSGPRQGLADVTGLSSGVAYATRIKVEAPWTFTKIRAQLGATVPAGVTAARLIVWTTASGGAVLAQTADLTASIAANAYLDDVAFAASPTASLALKQGQEVWAGLAVVATTPPSVLGHKALQAAMFGENQPMARTQGGRLVDSTTAPGALSGATAGTIAPWIELVP